MNTEPSFTADPVAKAGPLSGRGGQYLTFVLAGEEYGVPILQVREIIEFTKVTPVPMTSPWILGIINLRGNVVPVVDLAQRFGLESTDISKRTCIVIVEVEKDEGLAVVGVQVDGVREVADLPDEKIQEPPAFGSRVAQDSLLGVGQTGDGFALLLDVNRVFPIAQIGDLDQMTESSPPALDTSATGTDASPTEPDVAEPAAETAPPDPEAEEEVEPDKPRRPRRRARKTTK